MNNHELIEWLKEERLWVYFQGIKYEIIENFVVVNDHLKRDEINYGVKIQLNQKGLEALLVNLIQYMKVEIRDIEIIKGEFLIIHNLQSNKYDFDEVESMQDVLASQVESDFFKRGEQNV